VRSIGRFPHHRASISAAHIAYSPALCFFPQKQLAHFPFAALVSRNCVRKEAKIMVQLEKPAFDTESFLASAGLGQRIVKLAARENFLPQGDPADSVFYLQKGRAKITVVSRAGKEATIALLDAGEFVGEDSLVAVPAPRLATATAIVACTALKITREEMVRALYAEHAFSDLFLKFLLARSIRIQADLVDQLFNSSERRLARILLLMAEFGQPGEPEPLIPKISQETLAEMIGTTRSRVSFFMNRFRKLGFISYDGRIRVHKSLLNVVLHDRPPGDNDEMSDLPAMTGDEPQPSNPSPQIGFAVFQQHAGRRMVSFIEAPRLRRPTIVKNPNRPACQ
jgi:CRP-like cAMP-binding protein